MEDRFGFSRLPSPKRCPDCGAALGPLSRGYKYASEHSYSVVTPPFIRSDSTWRRCGCECYVVWSYPNVWVRRHKLPIFDMKYMQEVVLHAP